MKRFREYQSSILFMLLSGVVLGCCVSAAPAQFTLNGYWDLRTPNPSEDGTILDTFLQLQQNGNTITGRLIRWHHSIPIAGALKHQ